MNDQHGLNTVSEISESDACTTYPISACIYEGRTTVGTDVIIADSPIYGRLLFLDGELQSASADEHIYHETLVHPAISLAGDVRHVLVVGGGEGATVREVVRWSGGATVDWVDYDADLVALCRRYMGWAPYVYDNPGVRFMPMDIRDALPHIRSQYDVIILDLPDPDGDTGYLYSPEFWEAMKERLSATGRLVTHCGPVRPFGCIGGGFQRIHAALHNSSGFYPMSIPSFQGEWGFWMWRVGDLNPFEGAMRAPPWSIRVADSAQLSAWSVHSRLWAAATSSATTN